MNLLDLRGARDDMTGCFQFPPFESESGEGTNALRPAGGKERRGRKPLIHLVSAYTFEGERDAGANAVRATVAIIRPMYSTAYWYYDAAIVCWCIQ